MKKRGKECSRLNAIGPLDSIFKNFSLKDKRAQGAMEFISTYGSAMVFIVTIIIALLVRFDILDPDNFLPEQCIIPIALACLDSQIGTDSVTLALQNSFPDDVTIKEVVVEKEDGTSSCSNSTPMLIKKGKDTIIIISGCNNGNLNERFKGNIYITYEKIKDYTITLQAKGEIIGRIEIDDDGEGEGEANQPPTVNAGVDQIITLPDSDAVMDAVVTDPEDTPILLWTQESGPAVVSFSDDTIEDPTVTGLTLAGDYILKLTADDGNNPIVSDTVVITVNAGGGGTSFISTWDTTKTSTGSSGSNQVKLPLESSGTYNFVVDWGDGNQDTITIWNQPEVTHTYTVSGIYTLDISGTIEGFRFNNGGDRLKISEISQWGDLRLGNSNGYFYGTGNLDITATDILDLTGTTTMFNAFRGSGISTVPSMNEWDVSGVTRMGLMSSEASSFNQPIGNWDVSAVTNMARMFEGIGFPTVFNQPIGNWDVSAVTDMNGMFKGSLFNQPIGNWDVSAVTNMARMFQWNYKFNQPIGNWNTLSVTNMNDMFESTPFNQPIGNWDVSAVTNMAGMFLRATAFNQPIGNWDVSRVTSMGTMFEETPFNQPIGNWDVSSVTNMNYMFNIVTLSTVNYDNLLIGWNNLPSLQTSVSFHGGNSKYSPAAQAARQNIINTYSWIITDGGPE